MHSKYNFYIKSNYFYKFCRQNFSKIYSKLTIKKNSWESTPLNPLTIVWLYELPCNYPPFQEII